MKKRIWLFFSLIVPLLISFSILSVVSLIVVISTFPVTNVQAAPPATGAGMYFDGSATEILIAGNGGPMATFNIYDHLYWNYGLPDFYANTWYFFTDLVSAQWADTPQLMTHVPPDDFQGDGGTAIVADSTGTSILPSPTHSIKIAVAPDIRDSLSASIFFSGWVLPDGSSLHIYICGASAADWSPDPDSTQTLLHEQESLPPGLYTPNFPFLTVGQDIFYGQWIVFEIGFPPVVPEFSPVILPILLILPAIIVLIWNRRHRTRS